MNTKSWSYLGFSCTFSNAEAGCRPCLDWHKNSHAADSEVEYGQSTTQGIHHCRTAADVTTAYLRSGSGGRSLREKSVAQPASLPSSLFHFLLEQETNRRDENCWDLAQNLLWECLSVGRKRESQLCSCQVLPGLANAAVLGWRCEGWSQPPRAGDGKSCSALYSFLPCTESSDVLHAHICMLKMKVVTIMCDLIYSEYSHYNTQILKAV